MKKILFGISFVALMMNSCKPELKGELGDPSDKLAGMQGTWQISSFVQQDPNNPIKEERDLSDFYIIPGETPYQLTFVKEDRTYTVQPGPGKNYFGTGGTWAFDNEQFPTYLYLYNSSDTLELLLGDVVRESDNSLSIELEKNCYDAATGTSTPLAIYKFNFNRIN
ncbi:MAG: DUF5004 domain-containing protein [Flavobacteriales bacterium]|nr:DUF5004 domain-containing protein [Flavobacteriales bacterium]